MKSLRVLMLVHESLVPKIKLLSPQERLKCGYKTEYDVYHNLRARNHNVEVVGLYDDLKPLKAALEKFEPDIVFNLLEEFNGEAILDQNIVAYLELMGVPYTGCNPRGLMIARDKGLSKEILSYHKINVPDFLVFQKDKPVKVPKKIHGPMIVKCLIEEASLGISKSSVVTTSVALKKRVEYLIKKFDADVICEEFISGREFYVGLIGNDKTECLPIWELSFSKKLHEKARLATMRVKFNEAFRKKNGIVYGPAKKLNPKLEANILNVCKKTYSALKLSGYARIDVRLNEKGDVFVLEANPNPDIAFDEEMSESAMRAGYTYGDFLEKMLELGLN